MSNLLDIFEFAAGSVRGTSHESVRKPNQDAYTYKLTENCLVGIVCDGCGDPSSMHSEVGAHLGTKLLAASLLEARSTVGLKKLERARANTLAAISTLACDMSTRYNIIDLHLTLRNYFLFTAVCFYIDPEVSYFFSIGDGALWVNGEQIAIGPFPNNAPPYMCYELMDSSMLTSDPGCLKFQLRKEIPTAELDSFLIGCDGVLDLAKLGTTTMPTGREYIGSIDQFWIQDKYFQNPEIVNRRLYLINKDHKRLNEDGTHSTTWGKLRDDTTLISGRRIKIQDD